MTTTGLAPSGAILRGSEEAPEGGLDAHDLEVVSAHELGEDLFGLLRREHGGGNGEAPGGETVEDLVLVAIVLVIRMRHLGEPGGGVRLVFGVDHREPSGIRHRKRVEEDGVHHREDGGVGANPESERGDGDQCEAGTLE